MMDESVSTYLGISDGDDVKQTQRRLFASMGNVQSQRLEDELGKDGAGDAFAHILHVAMTHTGCKTLTGTDFVGLPPSTARG